MDQKTGSNWKTGGEIGLTQTHVCRLFACARSGFGCCPHRWSDQRCFDPGRHEGIGGRATPKPVQGQDRAQPAGEGLRSLPLPMGHAPAAARSRRWSADPLLKCNPTNWKSKSVVGKVLSKNVKIRKCVFFYLFDRFTFEHLNRLEGSHFRSEYW